MMELFKSVLNQTASFLKRRRYLTLFLIIFLWVVYALLMGDNGLLVRYNLEVENKELKAAIKREAQIQDSLRKEIKLLQTDKKRIEKAAREKYGMVKPGETLYKVQISDDTDK